MQLQVPVSARTPTAKARGRSGRGTQARRRPRQPPKGHQGQSEALRRQVCVCACVCVREREREGERERERERSQKVCGSRTCHDCPRCVRCHHLSGQSLTYVRKRGLLPCMHKSVPYRRTDFAAQHALRFPLYWNVSCLLVDNL